MTNDDYREEVKTRERIVQIFLIIAGFLLAYSNEGIKKGLVLIFALYIIFILLYYIYLTRTKNDYFINFYGFISSYMYSLFLIIFFHSILENQTSPFEIFWPFLIFTGLFTFALMSPNTNDKVIKKINTFLLRYEKKHKKVLKWILFMLLLLLIIWISYISIWGSI